MQTRYIKYELMNSEEPYDKINKILTEFMVLGISAELFELTETYIVFEIRLPVRHINLTDYFTALDLTDEELNYLVMNKILIRIGIRGDAPVYSLRDTSDLIIKRLRDYLCEIGKLNLVYAVDAVPKINL